MADAGSVSNGESSNPGPKYHAPKDRKCQFCGVAFTSSSLGRHLDQFIKPQNPKAPDGIHDVDEIRKMREGITRRQPRNSMRGGRASTLTPVSTPRAASSVLEADAPKRTPASSIQKSKDSQYTVDAIMTRQPFKQGWEQTGVMHDVPKGLDSAADGAQGATRRAHNQRRASRQVLQKAQFDERQRLDDAMDTARAAELAFRELMESWRAANQHIDGSSKPFNFDPLALDFPALTLQCLQPSRTLFSSTQFPTPSSWSTQSPASREFDGLKAYFKKEFKEWRMKCAAATASDDELTYPPKNDSVPDRKENIKRAETAADELERQIKEHLDSSYAVWESLSVQRRNEVWLLEMARSVGRKHEEVESLKKERDIMMQKIGHLQSQINPLNRQEQPHEFKLWPPLTVPLERKQVARMLELGYAQGMEVVGLSEEDRPVDTDSVVTRAIQRWKAVVVSRRVVTSDMCSQRPLPDSTPPVPPLPEHASQIPSGRHPLPSLQPKSQPNLARSRANSQKSRQIQPPTRETQQTYQHASSLIPPQPKRESMASVQEPVGEAHAAALSEHETPASERPDTEPDAEAGAGAGAEAEAEAEADGDGEVCGDDDSESDGDGDADGDEDVMDQTPDLNADDDGMEQEDEDADGDEDADAEMEDDVSFQMMHATPAAAQEQLLHEADMLHVPRTRGHAKEHVDAAFILQHGLGPLAASRSVPGMNASIHGAMVPGVHDDDTMYME